MENAADVLDNLPLQPMRGRPRLPDLAGPMQPFPEEPSDTSVPAGARDELLSLLSPEPTMVDDLMQRCHLSPSVTMAVLLELELAGRIETLAGSRVALLPEAIE